MPHVRLHGVHSDHSVRIHGVFVVVAVSMTTENNIQIFETKNNTLIILPEFEQAKISSRRFLTSPFAVKRIFVAFNVAAKIISLLIKAVTYKKIEKYQFYFLLLTNTYIIVCNPTWKYFRC